MSNASEWPIPHPTKALSLRNIPFEFLIALVARSTFLALAFSFLVDIWSSMGSRAHSSAQDTRTQWCGASHFCTFTRISYSNCLCCGVRHERPSRRCWRRRAKCQNNPMHCMDTIVHTTHCRVQPIRFAHDTKWIAFRWLIYRWSNGRKITAFDSSRVYCFAYGLMIVQQRMPLLAFECCMQARLRIGPVARRRHVRPFRRRCGRFIEISDKWNGFAFFCFYFLVFAFRGMRAWCPSTIKKRRNLIDLLRAHIYLCPLRHVQCAKYTKWWLDQRFDMGGSCFCRCHRRCRCHNRVGNGVRTIFVRGWLHEQWDRSRIINFISEFRIEKSAKRELYAHQARCTDASDSAYRYSNCIDTCTLHTNIWRVTAAICFRLFLVTASTRFTSTIRLNVFFFSLAILLARGPALYFSLWSPSSRFLSIPSSIIWFVVLFSFVRPFIHSLAIVRTHCASLSLPMPSQFNCADAADAKHQQPTIAICHSARAEKREKIIEAANTKHHLYQLSCHCKSLRFAEAHRPSIFETRAGWLLDL